MAKRGVVNEFFSLEEFNKQLNSVTAGIKDYVDQVNKVHPIRASLKGAEDLKPVLEGVKNLNAEQAKYAQVLATVEERIAKLNGSSGEFTKVLLNETKAQKELAIAQLEGSKAATEAAKQKLLDAKASVEHTKQLVIERREREANERAAKKEAEASAKAAAKKTEESRPYKQLALAFTVAAAKAQDLAVQYGINDKRAQAAAKQANALNNQLKKIDDTVGITNRRVGSYNETLDRFSSKLKGAAVNFLALIGVAGAGSFFSSSIDEFVEMDKNVRLLQNTLNNIGIPEAFGRIESSANKMADKFKFLDNDDVLKVFNQLIVYGKLTEKQINELIPVIVDFSTATGQDLSTSASLLIKAMEGNGKALKEFGIDMKDAKTVTEGFDLIMTQLKPRIEGVGQAFGDSAAGGLATAKQEFKNLKEEIGQGLLPVLVSLLSGLNNIGKGLVYLGKQTKTVLQDIFDLTTQGDVGVLFGKGEGRIKRLEETQKRIEKTAAKNIADQELAAGSAGEAIAKLNQNLIDQQNIIDRSKREGSIFDAKDIAEANRSLRVTRLALEEIFKIQANGDNILGSGDPNKEKNKKEKHTRDLLEADRKALFERLKASIELDKEFDLIRANDEKRSFEDRISNIISYGADSQRLIEAQAAFEIHTAGLTKAEKEKIESDKNNALIRLATELNDKLKKIARDSFESGTKKLPIDENIPKELQKILDDFSKAQKKAIEDAADNAKKLKAAMKDALSTLAEELGGLFFDVFKNAIEREKNAVQEQIDLLEQKKQKDIEVANQTITNVQEREAAISIIEARAAAKREQLQQRQRQLDQQKARFEKAQSVARIVQSTVEAVMSALGAKPWTPANIALAAVVGAIGAAQLVRVLAQPIPKYKHGTKDHPGGFAEVGDGGKKELVVTPDGKMHETPAKSTIVDLPKHTKVFPDVDEALKVITHDMHHRSEIRTRDVATSTGSVHFEKMNKTMKRGFQTLASTISKKKEIHFEKLSISERVNRHIQGNKEYFKMNDIKGW